MFYISYTVCLPRLKSQSAQLFTCFWFVPLPRAFRPNWSTVKLVPDMNSGRLVHFLNVRYVPVSFVFFMCFDNELDRILKGYGLNIDEKKGMRSLFSWLSRRLKAIFFSFEKKTGSNETRFGMGRNSLSILTLNTFSKYLLLRINS